MELETKLVHSGPKLVKKGERSKIPGIDFTSGEDEAANECQQKLCDCIASLEVANHALVYPCGTSAMASIVQLLKPGDHAVVFDSVYHGTRTYFSLCVKMGNINVSFVDLRNPDVLEKHIQNNTKMVWIETPSNPTMKLVDIAAIAEIVHKYSDIFLVVDNTFMTPYFQTPLLLGADIVTHSLTKYLNGFGDVLLGASATNNDDLYHKLEAIQKSSGSMPRPLECYLVLRGLKTLHLRMEKHMENAMKIAEYLESHKNVEKVYYPGLKSHPQYELACKQCKGFSGIVSFQVKGGKTEAFEFGNKLQIFTLAVSLGSPESLCDVSSFMTASRLNFEERKELGVTDNLIRLSIGLESAEDLISDLEQALRV